MCCKQFWHLQFVKKIVKYDDKKIEELLQDAGIIRNRLKVKSVVSNAKVFMEIQKEFDRIFTIIP